MKHTKDREGTFTSTSSVGMSPGGAEWVLTTPSRLLRERSRDEPDTEIVATESKHLTFAQWDRRAATFARFSRGRYPPASRFALVFERSEFVEYAVATIGVQRAGYVPIPVDLSRLLYDGSARRLTEHSSVAGLVVATTSALRTSEGWWDPYLLPMELFAEDDEDRSPSDDDEDVTRDVLELILTSGTSGAPQLVEVFAEDVSRWYHQSQKRGSPASRRRMLLTTAIGTNATQMALRNCLGKATLRLAVPRDVTPSSLWLAIEHWAPEVLALVPTTARLVVGEGHETHDTSRVQLVIVTSAPASAGLLNALHARFPGAVIRNSYGVTELGVASIRSEEIPAVPGLLGRPSAITAVKIQGDNGEECLPGSIGEIWMRDTTRSGMSWVNTGDLGFVDIDGRIHLVDRKIDVMISKGFKVSTIEVESIVETVPGVLAVAVFGVPYEDREDEEVVAAVVARSDETAPDVLKSAIVAYCRDRLPPYAVPSRIIMARSLPLNAAGKVDKRMLREEAREIADFEERWSVAEIRAAVKSAWQDVFSVEAGPLDNFYDYGGKSLDVIRIMELVESTTGIALELTDVLDSPTLHAICNLVVVYASRSGKLRRVGKS